MVDDGVTNGISRIENGLIYKGVKRPNARFVICFEDLNSDKYHFRNITLRITILKVFKGAFKQSIMRLLKGGVHFRKKPLQKIFNSNLKPHYPNSKGRSP